MPAVANKYKFLTDKQRREYGAVIRLTMPGNMAAQIKWKNRPTKLDFVIEKERLIIRQDGEDLAHAELQFDNLNGLQQATVNWGHGVFGKLNGRLLSTSHWVAPPPNQ